MNNDLLQLAEWVLTAALACVIISIVCNVVILTSRKSAASQARKTLVTAGSGGPGTVEIGGERIDVTADAAPPARASKGLSTYATSFAVVAFILLTVYLGIRWFVVGHGPFSNQHEYAVSFTWGIMLAYIIVELRYHIRTLSVTVLPVAACLMLYAMRLNTEVEPLVPALQNKLLLTLHVGFAILASGAAAVSFGAAVMYLTHDRLKIRAMPRKELLDEIGYKAAVFTFPMLTIMNVLGAIWADIAWGRYWSWDPKETASLVVWLIYGAYLHARVVRGWRGTKSAWLLVLGFASVLFVYFGNHFFGGLHSYA